jgi:hypothetical protein
MAENEKIQSEPSEFVEHMKEAGKATVDQWKSLIPQDFWDHGKAARREVLLAMRSLVDSAIDRLESQGERAPQARRKTKVAVE